MLKKPVTEWQARRNAGIEAAVCDAQKYYFYGKTKYYSLNNDEI